MTRNATVIGVPKEVKNHEYRVAMTPSGVVEAIQRGHHVVVEAGAGQGSSLPDSDYVAAGARIVDAADDVWGQADLVLKVKEPIAEEFNRLRRGQVLFTYLHLAASREAADALLQSGITSIAYETVQLPDRSLPLLAPMSEVAGRLGAHVGAYQLMKHSGARGVLMGGVPGVPPARVVVLGGGVSGTHAASMAVGMGADVTVIDLSVPRLRQLDAQFGGRLRTLTSNSTSIEEAVRDADLVIGAVLVPGAEAPKLVSNGLVEQMREGSVLVDIAIDQGGCFADSKPTTHAQPTYRVHNSVFYCVANMPGSVPHTSTAALTNVTLPYVLALADKGWRQALRDDQALASGLHTHEGHLTNDAVASTFKRPSVSPAELLVG